MNDERSPALERLFTAADRELSDDGFVAGVMMRTGAPSVRGILVVAAVILVAVPATWLVAGPLDDAVLWLTRMLSQPLADVGDGIAGRALLPMNTVGAAVALALLALRAIGRRLFSAYG